MTRSQAHACASPSHHLYYCVYYWRTFSRAHRAPHQTDIRREAKVHGRADSIMDDDDETVLVFFVFVCLFLSVFVLFVCGCRECRNSVTLHFTFTLHSITPRSYHYQSLGQPQCRRAPTSSSYSNSKWLFIAVCARCDAPQSLHTCATHFECIDSCLHKCEHINTSLR